MNKRPRIQGAMGGKCMLAVAFTDATRCLVRVFQALFPLLPSTLDYSAFTVLHWLTCSLFLRLSAVSRSNAECSETRILVMFILVV